MKNSYPPIVNNFDPAYHPNSVTNPSNVILPQQSSNIKRCRFVTIDSADRDLELYPDPNYFQVKFQGVNDCKQNKCERVCNILYEKKEIVEGSKGAVVEGKLSNILYIYCSEALVPNEPIYICGQCPNKYYEPSVDVKGSNPVRNLSYRPIWTSKIGTTTTILDENYLFLNIPELADYSPYYGTNTPARKAFAKLTYATDFGALTSFIKLNPSCSNEYYLHAPTALATVDKMTLSLQTSTGKRFNFGRDKLFIKSISQGSPLRSLPKDAEEEHSTRIRISTNYGVCKCRTGGKEQCQCLEPITSHCLKPGDLIYIYDTVPCNPSGLVIYKEPYKQIFRNFKIKNLSEMGKNIVQLSLEISGTNDFVNFQTFLCKDDFLVLRTIDNCLNYFKVIDVHPTCVTICENNTFILQDDLEIKEILYAKRNNKGIQSSDPDKLNTKDGIRVCNVNSGDNCECIEFDIEYPFSLLCTSFLENYKEGDMFFIKDKLQISYTFEFALIESDYTPLNSQRVINN